MTGPDHYREAERLIAEQAKVTRLHDDTCPEADRMLAEAQVHATLALAAATALNDNDGGMPSVDFKAWDDVAGVKPEKH
jgi:hypothetical protein